jgi:DNA-binding SARP family transcriptional activator
MQDRVEQPQSLRQGHPPILALHIYLFGEFRLESSETDVPTIEMPRLQSLLAYLLLHRTAPQSRAHLAFLLWPDSTEEQAQTNLRKVLYLLRQTFPHTDSFLHIRRQSLSWKPDAQQTDWTLDVQDFEHALVRTEQAEHLHNLTAMRQALAEAVELYRGDRLRQAFFKALERLIVLLEPERDDVAAISAALRLLRHDPGTRTRNHTRGGDQGDV